MDDKLTLKLFQQLQLLLEYCEQIFKLGTDVYRFTEQIN